MSINIGAMLRTRCERTDGHTLRQMDRQRNYYIFLPLGLKNHNFTNKNVG